MKTSPRWEGVRWLIAVVGLLGATAHAQEIKGQQGAAATATIATVNVSQGSLNGEFEALPRYNSMINCKYFQP